MERNCWEQACKYCDSDLDVLICRHPCQPGTEVSELISDCPYFEEAKTCLTCKHAIRHSFELEEIDSVDYFCPFIDEGHFLVYSDTNPSATHFIDVPECGVRNSVGFERTEE